MFVKRIRAGTHQRRMVVSSPQDTGNGQEDTQDIPCFPLCPLPGDTNQDTLSSSSGQRRINTTSLAILGMKKHQVRIVAIATTKIDIMSLCMHLPTWPISMLYCTPKTKSKKGRVSHSPKADLLKIALIYTSDLFTFHVHISLQSGSAIYRYSYQYRGVDIKSDSSPREIRSDCGPGLTLPPY